MTLVGPGGGIGKTRLSIEGADAAAIVRRRGLVRRARAGDGTTGSLHAIASGIAPRCDRVRTGRADRGVPVGSDCLVVIDNCEHVIDAVADADRGVGRCRSGTSSRGTSRSRWGWPGSTSGRRVASPTTASNCS